MGYEDIHEHLVMLGDRVRCDRFADAIARVVRPGDRVLDLGCGTGLLSVLAARAGAACVDAVDDTPIVAAARRIAKDSGCPEIRFHACDARALELDGQVDVLVSECMGHFVIYERMLEVLPPVRERLLRPGGRVIPARLDMMLAPVTSAAEDQRRRVLFEHPSGVDFGLIADWPLHRTSRVRLSADDVTGDRVCVGRLELASLPEVPRRFSGEACLSGDATIRGLAGYFDAELCPGVTFSTGPGAAETHWDQLYFPLAEPLEARAGDTLAVALEATPTGRHAPPDFSWTVRVGGQTRRGDELGHRLWLRRHADDR